MFAFFSRHNKNKIKKLYDNAVIKARSPFFYKEIGVADDMNGRFDMIALHVALIMIRMKEEKGGKDFNQTLFDLMFKNMDQGMREMGVGDLSVPKQMKKMMQAFNGRVVHYEKALQTNDDRILGDVLRRNALRTVENIDENMIQNLITYIKEQYAFLEEQPAENFFEGLVSFNNIKKAA